MTGLSEVEFQEMLARITAGLGPLRQPKTLEEVLAKNTSEASENIRPRTQAEVLAMPKVGMNLSDLLDLMKKYVKVVESGAYLSVWTDYAATPNITTDPVMEGRRSMSNDEETAYDWFVQFGNLAEFDWDTCRKQGRTPDSKKTKLQTEVDALRLMYKKHDLTEENFYWLRENKQAHFKVVQAFAKIIKAQHDIDQGVPENRVHEYKEYQTCNKLIATCGNAVNDFMALIRKLTKPIEETNQVLIARRYEMGVKCGLKVRKRGALGRRATELGMPTPGTVHAESMTPQGRKTMREAIMTLKELRSDATTASIAKVKFSDYIQGGKRKEPYRSTSPSAWSGYDPGSPKFVMPSSSRSGDVEVEMYGGGIQKLKELSWRVNAGDEVTEDATMVKDMVAQVDDQEIMERLDVRAGTHGLAQLGLSERLSCVGMVTVACLNRLLRNSKDWLPYVKRAIREGKAEEWMISNGGYISNWGSLDDELTKVKGSVGALDADGDKILNETEATQVQTEIIEVVKRLRRGRSAGPVKYESLEYKGRAL
jgi:hypothetical protein